VHFVSKCNGGDLDRPTIHQARQPEPLRAVLARISDDSHGASDGSQRKCRLPGFEILPSRPLRFWLVLINPPPGSVWATPMLSDFFARFSRGPEAARLPPPPAVDRSAELA
jgi:hypothetical protein